MSTCPACKKNKLICVGDTYQCEDSECGFIQQIKIRKAQKWHLKIADNEKVYWRRVFFADLPELEDEALFSRYLDEIKKYYGDKLFGEAVTMLYAIVTARESLTMKEIAWLSGEKHITIKQLTFIKDFGALLKTTRDRNRGALVSAASERYREYIEKMFPGQRDELGEIFTDMLTAADLKEYKNEQGSYSLPDGLTYIAAYLPTVLDEIPDELFNRVYSDDKESTNINNCTKNSMEPHILSRRAKMGEVWSEYCGNVGLYKNQLDFINISGNCYWTMCDYSNALDFRNKQVKLGEEYFDSGKIDDENYVATAYMNRGVTYDDLGKYAESLSDYGKCIEIREKLHADGKLYDENDLALSYMNRGGTHWSTGKYAEALSDYAKCIEIRERLHADGKLYDENDLASAYMNRGVTYDDLGKYAEALSDYGKCIEIRERLYADGKLYDENDLASAYMNRGNTLGDISQYDEALSDYGKCIEISKRLHADGKLYDLGDLAMVMLNKGILLATGLNDQDGALAIFNEAIAMLEAEKELSYSANDTLQRLYYHRDRLTGNSDDLQSQLEVLFDKLFGSIDDSDEE
ncbi:MAG: tetratricopeptide repeat protein [Acutalibacteraceae bacterium]